MKVFKDKNSHTTNLYVSRVRRVNLKYAYIVTMKKRIAGRRLKIKINLHRENEKRKNLKREFERKTF
jgi:hypothetical protein